ncbi:MAG: hypothetical protein KDC54_18750 [Lewinella sp.]|nr:hypothetical protein [Lewinella sp.]
MRVVMFALSLVAGVVLFFLFAKLLVSGLFFFAALAFFGLLLKGARRLIGGPGTTDWSPDDLPWKQTYRYPALAQQAGPREDGSFRYRTITIQ